MPEHGFLTPKAIANKIKSKGLQKLRWNCQMCQTRCRDENVFKCHTMSEYHQRQLLLFVGNPNKYIDQFSQRFLDDFMHLLKRRFGNRRVPVYIVYEEYMADRNHLHMNATQWKTLTEFVKWCGREGHITVDETEGWFISYIGRNPETIQHQESLMKSEKMKLDDEERIAKFFQRKMEKDKGKSPPRPDTVFIEERMAKFFQRKMEKDKEKSHPRPDTVFTELKKESEDDKVAFSMQSGDKSKKLSIDVKQNALTLASTKNALPSTSKKLKEGCSSNKKRKLPLEEITEQEQSLREKKNRKDYWLSSAIVVKVISKKLGYEFYKCRAIVREVKGNDQAIIESIESRERILAQQEDLETEIPDVGRKVLILNGSYRGCRATITDIKVENFSVSVRIISGAFKGKVLDSVSYEDVSELYAPK